MKIDRAELERALREADWPEDSMATDDDSLRYAGRAEAVSIIRDMLELDRPRPPASEATPCTDFQAILRRAWELADQLHAGGCSHLHQGGESDECNSCTAASFEDALARPPAPKSCTACDYGYPANACSSGCKCGAC